MTKLFSAMKTNSFETGTAACRAPRETGFAIGLPGFLKLILAFVGATWVQLATPTAMAGGADGEYAFVSASGTISGGGETLELPEDILQQIGAIKNGRIVVEDNKIQLNRKAALRIINQLGQELGIEFETSITGPTKLKLNKAGNTYVGETTEPIVVKFATTYEDEDISGTIKTYFKAKVKGDKLTLVVPLTIKALGKKFTGEVTVVCQR